MPDNLFLEFEMFRSFLLNNQFELSSDKDKEVICIKVNHEVLLEIGVHRALYIGEILVIESRKILDKR